MNIKDILVAIFMAVFMGVSLSLTIVLAAGEWNTTAAHWLTGMVGIFAFGAIAVGLAARFGGRRS